MVTPKNGSTYYDKKKAVTELLAAAKAVLASGHNPVFRCVDKDAEAKIEAELALKAQKEEALAEAERKLDEYQRELFGRA